VIGNDVVDLRDPDATPARAPRFDARVFDAAEQEVVRGSADPARLRWRLWAAKEAAYKAVVRDRPQTVFSPSRFRVRLDDVAGEAADETRGRVSTPAGSLPVTIRACEGAVHAWVCAEPGLVLGGMTRMALDRNDPHAPGVAVRRFAGEQLASRLAVPASALEIRKRGRVPELWMHGRRLAGISLSHHGDVVAFACETPDGRP
jgi:phosphopantetheinyl transferase (holo-ACP synthase)